MKRSDVTVYINPDELRTNGLTMAGSLVLTSGAAFKTQVTRIGLPLLTLVRLDEAAPRISFLSPDPATFFLSFPLVGESVWNGTRLPPGSIVLHALGEHVHQVTTSPLRWGHIRSGEPISHHTAVPSSASPSPCLVNPGSCCRRKEP